MLKEAQGEPAHDFVVAESFYRLFHERIECSGRNEYIVSKFTLGREAGRGKPEEAADRAIFNYMALKCFDKFAGLLKGRQLRRIKVIVQ